MRQGLAWRCGRRSGRSGQCGSEVGLKLGRLLRTGWLPGQTAQWMQNTGQRCGGGEEVGALHQPRATCFPPAVPARLRPPKSPPLPPAIPRTHYRRSTPSPGAGSEHARWVAGAGDPSSGHQGARLPRARLPSDPACLPECPAAARAAPAAPPALYPPVMGRQVGVSCGGGWGRASSTRPLLRLPCTRRRRSSARVMMLRTHSAAAGVAWAAALLLLSASSARAQEPVQVSRERGMQERGKQLRGLRGGGPAMRADRPLSGALDGQRWCAHRAALPHPARSPALPAGSGLQLPPHVPAAGVPLRVHRHPGGPQARQGAAVCGAGELAELGCWCKARPSSAARRACADLWSRPPLNLSLCIHPPTSSGCRPTTTPSR